jgi:ATP-dependent helicase/nuclease subunit B
MPHASPQLDWELADAITRRLLASAPEVCISYAGQKEGVEMRPSRLVADLAGAPQPMPRAFAPEAIPVPLPKSFEDLGRIPFPGAPPQGSHVQLSLFEAAQMQGPATEVREVRGGATVLTSQSQCAFKAFATARLGAQDWEPAEPGLTAAQRGKLLHAVLHSAWGGPPHGIRAFHQLPDVGADLRPFVEAHVRRVLSKEMPAYAREQMPRRYLDLEEKRLTRLVSEWLDYERTRQPFTVDATEVEATTNIASLTLTLRLDRVDRLNDGSLLVIDYKSGHVSPRSWDLPRPDDVQLPLYAGFALGEEELGGLVFATVRPGNLSFAGRVGDARSTLDNTLKGNSRLVTKPLTAEHLIDWRAAIVALAADFLAGRADVDPREYPKTCEQCGLYTLCRVKERDDKLEPEDELDGEEDADE